MSHPVAISCRCNRSISRRRRRIRLRRTALPSAFFMLQPNRLISRPLGRRNIVTAPLLRRRPSQSAASYSERRTSRQFRGRSSRGLSDARETVAPLLATLGQNFPSTLTLHALAKAVLLVTAAHMRLKRAFRQRSFSSALGLIRCEPVGRCGTATTPLFAHAQSRAGATHRKRISHPGETNSVLDPRCAVKNSRADGGGLDSNAIWNHLGIGQK